VLYKNHFIPSKRARARVHVSIEQTHKYIDLLKVIFPEKKVYAKVIGDSIQSEIDIALANLHTLIK
jgi:hypothetical protein